MGLRKLKRSFLSSIQGLVRSQEVIDAKAFLHSEGLGRFIESRITATQQPMDDHKLIDLARLYRLIRKRKPRIILEFGCGQSTLIMLEALTQNQKGKLHVVETSKEWTDAVCAKVPGELFSLVTFHVSTCRPVIMNGELCHRYESLPDVAPDFIYLDGPDPKQVVGSIDGLSFENRDVAAADPLLYESAFRPGFAMLVDGRQNNVEFLKRNLKRNYKVKTDEAHRVTLFELCDR